MKIDVLTIFPDYFSPLDLSLIKKARDKNILEIDITNIRDFAEDVHKSVDDIPYGGGPGMVMRPNVVAKSLDFVLEKNKQDATLIFLTPAGKKFDQVTAKQLSKENNLILLCGRYEGIDQRVIDYANDHPKFNVEVLEVSIGDYVLIGGEVAALVVIESIVRLLPGVLGNSESHTQDSFQEALNGMLEPPCYTRPENWEGFQVPSVLLSGNHKEIEKWRKNQSEVVTKKYRPDLMN